MDKMRISKYFRDRFYFRGASWLGLLNTVLAFFINRVIVRYINTETGENVKWSIRRGTDFHKVNIKDEQFEFVQKRLKEITKVSATISTFVDYDGEEKIKIDWEDDFHTVIRISDIEYAVGIQRYFIEYAVGIRRHFSEGFINYVIQVACYERNKFTIQHRKTNSENNE